MSQIKTCADKLIDLIHNIKRISLEDAAKSLGANKELVQEWAELLEKEKLISIDYSFSKTFLTERKATKKEIKTSAKDVVFEKDVFVNKVEYAIASLSKEATNFNEIKKKFNSLHGKVKNEVKTIEKEISELEKYDQLKTNIDKEIEKQKEEYQKEVEILNKDIEIHKSKFDNLNINILKKKEEITTHKEKIQDLDSSREDIEKSLKNAYQFIDYSKIAITKLEKDLKNHEKTIKIKQDSLNEMIFELDKLSDRLIKEKKKKIETLEKTISKSSEKIINSQDTLLRNARAKTAKLQNYERLNQKIREGSKGFFEKTIKISKKIEEIDKEKEELRNNLKNLYEKTKSFNILCSNSELKEQTKEIENEIKKQEESKKKFANKIKSLLNDLKV